MTVPLERDGELARIAAALDGAVAGDGRVVVIEGAAGIGKTRLIRETREMAKQRGFGRLQAIGDELENAMAWGAVRQMVERSISRYSGEIRDKILAGPTGAALAALAGAPAGTGAGDAEVARTLHALWWVAVDLSSTRPLLITVDDAQWADLPSQRFLVYLSRRVADLPIALVVATRPPDRSDLLAELTVARQVERLLPGPLTRRAVAEIGARRGAAVPCEQVTDAVHAASGGNPFLIDALFDELAAAGRPVDDPGTAGVVSGLGPSTVARAVLSRLPSEARRLAGALAVVGNGADPWLAGQVAGLDTVRLSPAVQALVTEHVVVAEPGRLGFIHPVVREATLAALGPVERAALHAKAAVALYAERAPAELVAAHLAGAPNGTLPEATDVLRKAAAASLAAGDALTASRHLARAFAERPDDTGLEADLGLALLRAGEPARARDHLRRAADSTNRTELLAAAASATSLVDGPETAVRELTAALAGRPGAELDPDRLVLEARLGIIRSFLRGERRKASAHLHRFAGLPGNTPDERTLLALLAQRDRYEAAPHAEVAAIAGRALAGGALLDDAANSIEGTMGWVLAVMALISADGVEPARDEIHRARRRLRRAGSPVEFAMVANTAMFLAWRCGDVTATEVEAESVAAAVAPEELSPHIIAIRATAAHFGVYTALERGDIAGARQLLDEFETQVGPATAVMPAIWLFEARARVALAVDDPTAARTAAAHLRDVTASAGVDLVGISWRVPAALAALRLGDEEDARRLAGDQLELARRWGAASDHGAALRLMAKVHIGDNATHLEALTEAVAVLEGAPDRLELAKALVDLGEAFRVARRRTDAREPLTRGGELASECGARVLRERAVDALAALGDRPRHLFSSGPDSLTASERRVARLAVGGRTNRDIAHELFVSPKTVENHLGRIYVKLGITGRRQLAVALT